MAGEDLFETLRRQAQAECDNRLAAAHQTAEQIAAKARSQADARRANAEKALQTELDHLTEHGRMLADAEAEKASLAMQNDVVEEVLESVGAALERLAHSADFGPVLELLLAEVMDGANSGVVVLAPPAHVDTCRRWLESHGRASAAVEPSPEVTDGVAIQDARKSYRITNSLTSRAAKLKAEARKYCMKILFRGGR